ncbi:unnamed protein product [Fraxinus pennsylvanica]|uniref:Protein kinase domain-containing protein n=1 Tax=Fraxinus pennsylvanica TaxID=56036 RepID=A0AAD2DPH3_9LAMI|nr:unnamed protein product [Fraxinus pennsylvanica]
MVGHVADFGIAKFLPVENISGNQSSSTAVKGTLGYAAPEYGLGSQPSPSGDVYSFGIVLLEMFIGKQPTNDLFEDGLTLQNFVKASLPDCVVEIMDPALVYYNWKRTKSKDPRNDGCLISVFEIGLMCSVDMARERMRISDVVSKLHYCRHKKITK